MRWWPRSEQPKDDRSGAVDAARAELALKMESAGDERDAELAEIWRRKASLPTEFSLTQKIPRAELIRMLVIAIVMPMVGSLALVFKMPGSLTPYATMFVIVGLIFLFARFERGKAFGASIELYTYYGRCAQCLSSLRGLSPEADGCVVCPECAAAWRASRIAPASVLDGLSPTDAPPTPAKPTPDHRDGRGWTWPPKPSRPTVKDAFARPVLLAPADLSSLSPEERAAIPAAVLQQIRQSAGNWLDRLIAVAARIGGVAILIWAAYYFVQRAIPMKFTPDCAFAALTAAGATCYAGMIAMGLPRFFRPETVTHLNSFLQVILMANRCPSCAGSLADVEPREHGVRRCPRCAAEWAPAGRVIAETAGPNSRAR